MTAPTPTKRAVDLERPAPTGLQVALSDTLKPALQVIFEGLDGERLGRGVSVDDVVADLERLGWSDIAEAYDNHCAEGR